VPVHSWEATIAVTKGHRLGGSTVVRRHASPCDHMRFGGEERPRPQLMATCIDLYFAPEGQHRAEA